MTKLIRFTYLFIHRWWQLGLQHSLQPSEARSDQRSALGKGSTHCRSADFYSILSTVIGKAIALVVGSCSTNGIVENL